MIINTGMDTVETKHPDPMTLPVVNKLRGKRQRGIELHGFRRGNLDAFQTIVGKLEQGEACRSGAVPRRL
jgi:hypothetical protein